MTETDEIIRLQLHKTADVVQTYYQTIEETRQLLQQLLPGTTIHIRDEYITITPQHGITKELLDTIDPLQYHITSNNNILIPMPRPIGGQNDTNKLQNKGNKNHRHHTNNTHHQYTQTKQ